MVAEIFANGRPIISDHTTRPNVTTAELKNAMGVLYNHMTDHRNSDPVELREMLDVIAEACNNENWVIFVP